jgi:hypothetical protein
VIKSGEHSQGSGAEKKSRPEERGYVFPPGGKNINSAYSAVILFIQKAPECASCKGYVTWMSLSHLLSLSGGRMPPFTKRENHCTSTLLWDFPVAWSDMDVTPY